MTTTRRGFLKSLLSVPVAGIVIEQSLAAPVVETTPILLINQSSPKMNGVWFVGGTGYPCRESDVALKSYVDSQVCDLQTIDGVQLVSGEICRVYDGWGNWQ